MHVESKGDPSQKADKCGRHCTPTYRRSTRPLRHTHGSCRRCRLARTCTCIKKQCGLKQRGRHQAYASSGYCRLASPVAGADAAAAAAAAAATHHPPAAPVAKATAAVAVKQRGRHRAFASSPEPANWDPLPEDMKKPACLCASRSNGVG